MENISEKFIWYCKSFSESVNKFSLHEKLVNDYMFHYHIYGENIYNILIDVSKSINKNLI